MAVKRASTKRCCLLAPLPSLRSPYSRPRSFAVRLLFSVRPQCPPDVLSWHNFFENVWGHESASSSGGCMKISMTNSNKIRIDISDEQRNVLQNRHFGYRNAKIMTLSLCFIGFLDWDVAEEVGFEPTKGVNPCRFSRPVHSTALPLLRSGLSKGLRLILKARIGEILPILVSSLFTNHAAR